MNLEMLLQLCLAIVADSTNFNKPQLLADTNWCFQSKRPIREGFANKAHIGEIAEFDMGIDKHEDGIYVLFGNSGDEQIIRSVKDFVNYIDIFRPMFYAPNTRYAGASIK